MWLTARGLPPFLLRHLCLRGLWLWALTRLTLGGLVALGGGSPVAIGAAATLWTIGLGVGLGFLEARRVRERVLFANLGLSPLMHSLPLLLAGFAGEVAVRSIAAGF